MQLNNSAVCTLFEGHYHYGVAALINSLCKNGFTGDIYAGYRGDLPVWATDANENPALNWKGAKTLKIIDGLRVHFLPLFTNWHLTNYKPDFMLVLKEKFIAHEYGIFYFDPDIVIKCPWQFFEKWVLNGVALVHEIVSVEMPPTHPVRKEWEKVIAKIDRHTQRFLYSGINGGFCGVSAKDVEFLVVWSDIIATAIKYYQVDPTKFLQTNDKYLFHTADQDALNMAAMSYESAISEMGPDAMDFMTGGWKVMSHATGAPKPWNKNFLVSSIIGVRPSQADKAYWFEGQGLIKTHSNAYIKFKRVAIAFSSFIGRFYKRN
jgi:hypothetical protein